MTLSENERATITELIKEDGKIVAEEVLKRGRSPDVTLAILAAALETVLSGVHPMAARKELEQRFFESLEPTP